MSILTVSSVKAAFWNVLKTDAAGAAVRAALSAGANGILARRQLAATPRPAAPFIVLQYGPVTGAAGMVRTFFPTWWLYADSGGDWYGLNALATLIANAYPDDAIAFCETRLTGGISDEVTDTALARPALAMRYQVRGRF